MAGINDRIVKLTGAFEADGFNVEETIIESGRIGVRASHKSAFDYDTGLPKKAYYVEGSHYQMGFLLGILSEPEINRMCTEFVDNLVFSFIDGDKEPKYPFLDRILGGILEDMVDELMKEMNPDIPPEIRDEFRGMADGCKKANPFTKVSVRHILTFNVGFDVLLSLVYTGDFLLNKIKGLEHIHLKIPMMCNGFAIFGKAAGNRHFLGRDFMFPTADVFQDVASPVIYNPDNSECPGAMPMVSVTAPGMAGSVAGMNINGIGMGVNMCPGGNCTPDQIGINSLLMVRYITQYAKSAEEAVDKMAELPRGVSWDYIIADGAQDRACIVEAGSSLCSGDFMEFPPEDISELLPDVQFIESHKSAQMENGLMVRWNDYKYPSDYLGYNEGLIKYYNKKYNTNKEFHPDAFAERGYIDKTLDENNCPGGLYFAPQRETREDYVLVSNHYIIPEMRLFGMYPWTGLVASGKYNDIQWRYDRLNDDILGAIEKGPVDYECAKSLLTFLAPNNGKYHSDYYKDNPRSKDGKEIRIEGSVSLFDLKAKTIDSHYGYYCDGWVKISLANYI
jgi:hypothetical protein